jgi:dUTP pyrophosphatase
VIAVRCRRLPHADGLALPRYETEGAAGLDLVAANPENSPILIERLGRALVPTGLVLELPSGYEGEIRPRSGLALRHGVTVLNSPGTIDADYRGEVMVLLVNFGAEPFAVRRGMRIAQLVVAPFARVALEESGSLDGTGRAGGGFGSTGA